jgi:hypothetical protein
MWRASGREGAAFLVVRRTFKIWGIVAKIKAKAS